MADEKAAPSASETTAYAARASERKYSPAARRKRLTKLILLIAAVGAGFTSGATLLRWAF